MGGAGWVAAPHPGEPELFGSEPSAYLPPGGEQQREEAVTGSAAEAPATAKPRPRRSPKHTCLFRSHEPRFAVLIAVNPHAAHPEADGRSPRVPSFCHALAAPRRSLLRRAASAGARAPELRARWRRKLSERHLGAAAAVLGGMLCAEGSLEGSLGG